MIPVDYRLLLTQEHQSRSPEGDIGEWFAPTHLPDLLLGYDKMLTWGRMFHFNLLEPQQRPRIQQRVPDPAILRIYFNRQDIYFHQTELEFVEFIHQIAVSNLLELLNLNHLSYAQLILFSGLFSFLSPILSLILAASTASFDSWQYTFDSYLLQSPFWQEEESFLFETSHFYLLAATPNPHIAVTYDSETQQQALLEVLNFSFLTPTFDYACVTFDQLSVISPHVDLDNVVVSGPMAFLDIEGGVIPITFDCPELFDREEIALSRHQAENHWQRWFWPNLRSPRNVFVVTQRREAATAHCLRYPLRGQARSWAERITQQRLVERLEITPFTWDGPEHLSETHFIAPNNQVVELLFSSDSLLRATWQEQTAPRCGHTLFLENAATGKCRGRLYRNGVLLSSFTLPAAPQVSTQTRAPLIRHRATTPLRRGGLPRHTTIEGVGVYLLGLAESHCWEEILYILNELVYCWGEKLENLTPEGEFKGSGGPLPSDWHWHPEQPVTGEYRDTVATAWLVLGVVMAVKKMVDAPYGERARLQEIETPLKLFLRHHGYFLARMVEVSSGRAYAALGPGGLVSATDDSPAFMALIALCSLLTLDFNLYMAFIAVFLEDRLSFRRQDIPSLNREETLALLLYSYLCKQRADLLPLCAHYETLEPAAAATTPTEARRKALFRYLQQRVPLRPVAAQEAWETLWQHSHRVSDPQVRTWLWLYDSNQPLRTPRKTLFWVYPEETLAYMELMYQTLRHYWPYGYDWTTPAIEERQRGNVGNLFHALSRIFGAWYIAWAILRDALTHPQVWRTAQDRWSLDGWISDDYMRQLPLPLATPQFPSKQQITPLWQQLLGQGSFQFHEIIPSHYTYNAAAYQGLVRLNPPPQTPQWVSEPLTFTPAQIVRILTGAGVADIPGFQGEEAFAAWAATMPQTQLYLYRGLTPRLRVFLERFLPLGGGVRILPTLQKSTTYRPISHIRLVH